MGTTGTPITGSPVTKADIETFVNSCLEDDVTNADLEEAIKLCMHDLSDLGLLMAIDTTKYTASGDLTIAVPDNYRDGGVENIYLCDVTATDVDDEEHAPLVPFSGGHEEYRQNMAASDTTGTPEYYSEYNGNFYIYPPADDRYHVRIEFSKYDTQDPDAIEFGVDFMKALKFGTVFWYATMKNRISAINLWGPLYNNEKEMRRLSKKSQPRIVR